MYIIKEDTITVISDDGVPHMYVRNKDNSASYELIKEAIKSGDFEEAINLIDVSKRISRVSNGQVTISYGVVYYKNEPVHNYVASKILQLHEEGFDVQHMLNFVENLMQNPSKKSVDSLYRFLEANDMPITEDGCFLAYKNVREDYYDKHSRTVYYGIGTTVSMDRNKVEDDPDITCSYGLHACSLNYINRAWGYSGKNLVVKIRPQDVVSVPYDYDNSKLRCCAMTVVKEIDFSGGVQEYFNKPVYTEKCFGDY